MCRLCRSAAGRTALKLLLREQLRLRLLLRQQCHLLRRAQHLGVRATRTAAAAAADTRLAGRPAHRTVPRTEQRLLAALQPTAVFVVCVGASRPRVMLLLLLQLLQLGLLQLQLHVLLLVVLWVEVLLLLLVVEELLVLVLVLQLLQLQVHVGGEGMDGGVR